MKKNNMYMIRGNIGNEVELKSANNSSVLNLNVAVDASYMKDQNWVKKTTWLRVSFWGKKAEDLAPHIRKGQSVQITGELSARSKEIEGRNYTFHELLGETLHIVPTSPTSPQNEEQTEAPE